MPRAITFLSDFGYEDEYAGACRAVIARLAPGATVVDLTHGIPAGDVRRGALALEAAAPRRRAAVHHAVVDPGVGSERRAVAIRTESAHLVGPDNGLLVRAADALGGPLAAADVSASALAIEPVAPTFHGRDLFAPVAAHLAAGRPLEAAGDPVDPAGLARLELPEPDVADGRARVHVLYADRFGNLVLDARPEDLAPLGLEAGTAIAVEAPAGDVAGVAGRTFADGARGEGLVLYEDSSGWMALAVNLASAAQLLGAGRDAGLTLRPAQ